MTEPYRVFVQAPSGAKFRAQGDVSDVRVELDRFYSVFGTPQRIPSTAKTNGHTPSTDEPAEGPSDAPEEQVGNQEYGLPRSVIDRLFKQDRTGTVSLLALPHGEKPEPDAMLALIYGAGRIAGQHQVSGSRLKKAAVQSGLNRVDRIDRAVAPLIGPLVTAAGFKKGRRYGLTNPGIRRAEEILTGILG